MTQAPDIAYASGERVGAADERDGGRRRLGAELSAYGRDVAVAVAVLAAVVGSWELAAQRGWISRVLLPPASEVATGVWELASARWFPPHLWATVQETVVGFALAFAVATGLAAAMHLSTLARRLIYPYVIVWKLIPAVVLAPVFVVWFGFGLTSKVLVAASISFFMIVVATLAGFDSADADSTLLMRSLGASRLRTFRLLNLRAGLPYMFAGMKTGITLSLVGAIVAEFITSRRGLGFLLIQFGYTFDQRLLFAAIVVIAVIGLVLFGLVTALERRVVWWAR